MTSLHKLLIAGPLLSGKYRENKNREKFYLTGHLDEKYKNAAISR